MSIASITDLEYACAHHELNVHVSENPLSLTPLIPKQNVFDYYEPTMSMY